jgi:hypothetical protein
VPCRQFRTASSTTEKPTGAKQVEQAMHERKERRVGSGRSGKTAASRVRAIGIGLSEARNDGAKEPKQRAEG